MPALIIVSGLVLLAVNLIAVGLVLYLLKEFREGARAAWEFIWSYAENHKVPTMIKTAHGRPYTIRGVPNDELVRMAETYSRELEGMKCP